jgi:hypothetical protein
VLQRAGWALSPAVIIPVWEGSYYHITGENEEQRKEIKYFLLSTETCGLVQLHHLPSCRSGPSCTIPLNSKGIFHYFEQSHADGQVQFLEQCIDDWSRSVAWLGVEEIALWPLYCTFMSGIHAVCMWKVMPTSPHLILLEPAYVVCTKRNRTC